MSIKHGIVRFCKGQIGLYKVGGSQPLSKKLESEKDVDLSGGREGSASRLPPNVRRQTVGFSGEFTT